MAVDEISRIAAYIAIAVPATVAITNVAKIVLEWLKQRHSIKAAEAQQNHQVTTNYLDRALDPTVPLAIRHQLLRFLATPERSGSRLSGWAESELKRIGGVVDETNMAVAKAERELNAAKNATEITNAERKLADAVIRQRSLLEPPVSPPITAAALRAGLIETQELSGLNMQAADLSETNFLSKTLRGANFSNATLTMARFPNCDLRAAIFAGANLEKVMFYNSDLRGADLTGAIVTSADFEGARLEGADMRCQSLEGMKIRAVYDENTKWPDGFEPTAAGAVAIDAPPSSDV
ncbi:MAG: pentapeptide repeat-containing protein [Methylobacter sp.]|nr:pentapeptide repeat-containing protein [Methylobacter sp.]